MSQDVGVVRSALDVIGELDRAHVRLQFAARRLYVGSHGLAELTFAETENSLAKTVLARGGLTEEALSDLVGEKKQVIRKSGTLQFYSSPERFGNIGGLDLLKTWLRHRALAFTDRARTFGLPEPSGLLLVGVPGCSNSLCAKAVAHEWQMPLLRFDLGKVFDRYVGQAEENMRRALAVAESVAPTILWTDEMEKGPAGAAGDSDSAVTARVLGIRLAWMQEKQSPVFVVATANDIADLSPDLLRTFDDVFFVDLPTLGERAEVFRIHLAKRGCDPDSFDLVALAREAERFSGSEIEQVVVDAVYAAFDAEEQLEDEHILVAIRATRPLAVQRAKQIDELRHWAADRCRTAPECDRAPEVVLPSIGQAPEMPRSQFGRAGALRAERRADSGTTNVKVEASVLMDHAVVHARVSSKEQAEEGFSIPARLKLLREYAADKGWGVVPRSS